MYKKILILIVLVLTFSLTLEVANAVTRTKLIDSPDASVVTYGTSSNSKYAYSFRVNNNTKIARTNVNDYDMVDVTSNDTRLTFVPTNSTGSGKIYAFIEDVGKYNGKQVDLKITFIYRFNEINGNIIHPVISLNLDKSTGHIVHHFLTSSYEVKYEIYSEGQPININMSFKLADIDYAQYFGFKLNSGTINSIQTVPGSAVYYENASGYRWFYETEYIDAAETPGTEIARQHTARLEIDNTSGFNLIIGEERDIYTYADMFTAPILECINPTTSQPYYTEDDIKQALINLNNEVMSGNYPSFGGVTFDASSYGPYTIPTPILYIEDNNELVQSNTLNDLEGNITYKSFIGVPLESTEFYYEGFNYQLDLPEETDIYYFSVQNESGEDVSSYFEITPGNNGTIVFNAKDNILSDSKFYNDTYTFTVKVNLDDETMEKIKTDKQMKIEGDGILTVSRGTQMEMAPTNTVDTTITYADTEASNNEEVNPNTTTQDSFKITTEVVNGTIDGSVETIKTGDDVTINYQANKGYKISKLIIDGEEIEINGYKTSYTFKDINKSHTIKVVFDLDNPNTGAFYKNIFLGLSIIGMFVIVNKKLLKKKIYHI